MPRLVKPVSAILVWALATTLQIPCNRYDATIELSAATAAPTGGCPNGVCPRKPAFGSHGTAQPKTPAQQQSDEAWNGGGSCGSGGCSGGGGVGSGGGSCGGGGGGGGCGGSGGGAGSGLGRGGLLGKIKSVAPAIGAGALLGMLQRRNQVNVNVPAAPTPATGAGSNPAPAPTPQNQPNQQKSGSGTNAAYQSSIDAF